MPGGHTFLQLTVRLCEQLLLLRKRQVAKFPGGAPRVLAARGLQLGQPALVQTQRLCEGGLREVGSEGALREQRDEQLEGCLTDEDALVAEPRDGAVGDAAPVADGHGARLCHEAPYLGRTGEGSAAHCW